MSSYTIGPQGIVFSPRKVNGYEISGIGSQMKEVDSYTIQSIGIPSLPQCLWSRDWPRQGLCVV